MLTGLWYRKCGWIVYVAHNSKSQGPCNHKASLHMGCSHKTYWYSAWCTIIKTVFVFGCQGVAVWLLMCYFWFLVCDSWAFDWFSFFFYWPNSKEPILKFLLYSDSYMAPFTPSIFFKSLIFLKSSSTSLLVSLISVASTLLVWGLFKSCYLLKYALIITAIRLSVFARILCTSNEHKTYICSWCCKSGQINSDQIKSWDIFRRLAFCSGTSYFNYALFNSIA